VGIWADTYISRKSEGISPRSCELFTRRPEKKRALQVDLSDKSQQEQRSQITVRELEHPSIETIAHWSQHSCKSHGAVHDRRHSQASSQQSSIIERYSPSQWRYGCLRARLFKRKPLQRSSKRANNHRTTHPNIRGSDVPTRGFPPKTAAELRGEAQRKNVRDRRRTIGSGQ